MLSDVVLEKIKTAREDGKTIGLVQGSWDMFHLGHLLYLQEAKKQCDFLVVGMDSDEKIKYRKGNNRPIIPVTERYQMIEKLGIADVIVVKELGEKKWELIKDIKPDVLIVIKENYTEEQIASLEEICGRVAILPRQATTSTSDIIRKTLISQGVKIPNKNNPFVEKAIDDFKLRIGFTEQMEPPIPELVQYLKKSTDNVVPVAACCFYNEKWHFGANLIDQSLSQFDIENRTELFYVTCEHAEINLLKSLGNVEKLSVPIWVTLFPCDKCMKVLIDKGVKEIYYLEDHPERNWSKRSHALALKKGVKTVQVGMKSVLKEENQIDFSKYKYIDPRNVRYQEQLDIMMKREKAEEDPLDPNIIDQEILFYTKNWYVSRNKFPYEAIEHQFLIVSRNPIYNLDNMSVDMWNELGIIWDRIIKAYNIPGGALCYRFGDTLYSGASLKRLHAHIIVPKEEYKARFTIGGNPVLKREFKLEND